jgi:D-alanyl-D-alanine carboxypeptidase
MNQERFRRLAATLLVVAFAAPLFAQETLSPDSDVAPLGPEDPMRYALGPPRPAPKEGAGWVFAAGELAMTAHDLALWDVSIIGRSILSPASYRALETEVELANGVGSKYGLGVAVGMRGARRLLTHGGEVSGFTARNDVFPDDRTAVVVQANLDATGASRDVARKIESILFETTDPKALAETKSIFEGLRHGKIDRSLFTSNANAYFTDQALGDFASSLRKLGLASAPGGGRRILGAAAGGSPRTKDRRP